jgi:ubiquinol oxidase
MATFEYTMGRGLDLKEEQRKTLASPVLPANMLLKLMFVTMDLLYGRKGSLLKFKVLEIFARYPYIAWELRAYKWITKQYAVNSYTDKAASEQNLHYIDLGRRSQDNEQMHLMMIEDIIRRKGIRQPWFRSVLLPRLGAFMYHYSSNLLFWIRPAWSFSMNARFESHAEHEYMKMVAEHPEWEDEPVETEYFDRYPRQKTMADLFRRIGLDERDHMYESMEEYERLTGRAVE